jgi:hypothetical protein
MATMSLYLSNPKAIADTGERIYRERYQKDFEEKYLGKFVAVSVKTGDATVGDSPQEALEQAKSKEPDGLFHLIRVGYPGAFQMGYSYQDADQDWIFG